MGAARRSRSIRVQGAVDLTARQVDNRLNDLKDGKGIGLRSAMKGVVAEPADRRRNRRRPVLRQRRRLFDQVVAAGVSRTAILGDDPKLGVDVGGVKARALRCCHSQGATGSPACSSA